MKETLPFKKDVWKWIRTCECGIFRVQDNENRDKLIQAVKDFIDENNKQDREHEVEFNGDYTKIRKFSVR